MIAEDLYPELETKPQPWPGYWRMSGLGNCQSALLAEAYGMVHSSESIAATDGKMHEIDMIRRLRALGHHVDWCEPDQIEIKLFFQNQEWPVRGHPDGRIITTDDIKYLLELKSKGYTFDRFKKFTTVREAFPSEFPQVQLYMSSVPEALNACLYISKSTLGRPPHEEIIRYDPYWLEQFLASHFAPVMDAHKKGDPPHTLSCHENEYVRRWCPLANVCKQDMKHDLLPGSTPNIDDEQDLLDAVVMWRQAKELADRAGEDIDKARDVFKKYLVQTQQQKVIIDGIPVQVILSKRENVDKEAVKRLIPEEMWGEVFSIKPIESLRVG
jgi:hypothetical protein